MKSINILNTSKKFNAEPTSIFLANCSFNPIFGSNSQLGDEFPSPHTNLY